MMEFASDACRSCQSGMWLQNACMYDWMFRRGTYRPAQARFVEEDPRS